MNKIKFLLSHLRNYKVKFIVSLFCMLAIAGLTSGSRLLVKPVVDKIFYAKDVKLLFTLVLIIPFVYLLIGIFTYIKNYVNLQIANDFVRKLRLDVFKHLQHISIDYFFLKSTTGHTLARITNDLNNIFNMVHKTPSVIVADITTLILLTFILFYLSLKFALLSMLVLPLALYPVYFFTEKLRYYSRRLQREIGELYNNLQESISAIFVTQIFNQQQREIEKFKSFNDKVYNAIKKFARVDYLASPVMELIGALGVAIVIYIGGKDVISGKWTPGSFFAFLATVLSFYQPLKRISEINPVIQQGLTSLERVLEILEQKSSVIEKEKPLEACFRNTIEFKNVTFSYHRNVTVLKNINLKIKRGQKIAIVGPSGAGKSTILNLLLRFYDVQEGEILIDGVNIKEFSLQSLRKLFGVVVQDTFLFNDTIWYNLTYGNPDATEQQVITATQMADIYDFIMSLPQKFNTIVGERGYSLSGGERQRLAIARALLKNPEILLFDEPTSALDAESEAVVLNAMKKLYSTKTIILITHRLNLVVDFDYIYVFCNGQIVEQGTHLELLSLNGFYSSLVRLQNLQH